jgi:hypothetical protein
MNDEDDFDAARGIVTAVILTAAIAFVAFVAAAWPA